MTDNMGRPGSPTGRNLSASWEQGLGKAVQLRRLDLDLTRHELASRAGISYPFLSEIEKGKKFPSGKKLGQVAEALNMKTSDLVALSGYVVGLVGARSDIVTELLAAAKTVGDADKEKVAPVSDAPSISTEARAVIEDMVAATLRMWGREVLPVLVEREVRRITTEDK